jgi:hypothetical protein
LKLAHLPSPLLGQIFAGRVSLGTAKCAAWRRK